jgi:AmmeMemoRadiSam system protein B
MHQIIRQPAVAGMFYPASESQLRNELRLMLDISVMELQEEGLGKNAFGIIVPHAGYVYSGITASYAYNQIKGGDFKTVIVISPSHREYFSGVCLYNGDAYRTPLGIIPVDKDKVDKLTYESDIIFKGTEGHRQEHALEVQLPFLQMVLDEFSLVPIVIGDQNQKFVFALAEKLSEIVDDKTLIVASSDLSHFHSKKEADYLDSMVERRITEFDYQGLQEDLEFHRCEACGGGPIVSLMRAADLLNRKKSVVLHRSDSGDVSGDKDEVVGYLSAMIYE